MSEQKDMEQNRKKRENLKGSTPKNYGRAEVWHVKKKRGNWSRKICVCEQQNVEKVAGALPLRPAP